MAGRLIVSLKNDALQIPQAFRQIEQWADTPSWNVFDLDANMSTIVGYLAPQWCLDALSWVNVRGAIKYTGTLANLAAVSMASMPNNLSPLGEELFPSPATAPGMVTKILPSGVIQLINQSGGSIVDPNFVFPNIRYAPWT